jgi:polyvinyl alcohol dehydrogenase (cytochrome)
MQTRIGRAGASGRLLLIILLGALTLASTVQGARAIGPARSAAGTPVAATSASESPTDWPVYGQDPSGAKANEATGLSTANVASLALSWAVEVGGPVSSTPVIAGGVAYVGSYDGGLYAIDLATGDSIWTYQTGAAVPEPNLQIPLGITGSAAVEDGVVYVGDATATVHAVDAVTGKARWTTTVDTQPNASIWSSPVVVAGTLYVGVASVAKQVGFRGSIVALDAATGDLLWQTYMVPVGADGAGVFAVPAVDAGRGLVYVGTQNAYSSTPAPYGNAISIVALDMTSGEVAWAFNAPPNDGRTAPTDDVGFSASPNLFTAEIDGASRDLIGEGQKSGVYWALDRATGAVVWQTQVSPAGFLGGMEGTSAVANGIIAVPATDWPAFDGPASGLVSGLDAATGAVLWTARQTAPAASPVGIADGLVFHAGLDGIVHAYDLSDGTELWSFDLGGSASGGIAIADGVVVVGAATPLFAPFIRPGTTVQAFALGSPGAATPLATPATPGT